MLHDGACGDAGLRDAAVIEKVEEGGIDWGSEMLRSHEKGNNLGW